MHSETGNFKLVYGRLSFRNVRRSFSDYLLYMTTVSILLAIMEISYFVSVAGKKLAGFQTATLPALIVMILIILICYMNIFIMKRRAKEFAVCLLMGMEKRKLIAVFLGEFWIMGLCCLGIGAVLGFGVSGGLCLAQKILNGGEGSLLWGASGPVYRRGAETFLKLAKDSLFHTFPSFCLTEGVCSFFIAGRIGKMQICDMLQEEKRNERRISAEGYRRKGAVFLVNLLCFLGGMFGIVLLPDQMASLLLSVITVPLTGSVFTGYRFLFGILGRAGEKRTGFFFRKERLYPMAWMLSNGRTDAVLSSVLCMCLLFSAGSFLFGLLLFRPEVSCYDQISEQWMGFLQICLCMIFSVLFFSVQSLLILTEIGKEAGNLKILYYMGKSRAQIRSILRRQTALRMSLPMWMGMALLLISTPLADRKLHVLLPELPENILLQYFAVFLLCTFFFYLLYFLVVCRMGELRLKEDFSRSGI